jgi:hypothetical protein
MEYPVGLVPTTRRRHITGTTALNIPERYRLGGDWHKYSTWFSHRPESLDDRDLTNERTYGRLLDLLGRWGLRDARRGLTHLGHPGARSTRTVWAASHDRAVIEDGWRRVTRGAEGGLRHPPFDQLELGRLLPYPDQWIRLRWWARRLRTVMTAAERELWDEWREEWWPWERAGRSTRRSY